MAQFFPFPPPNPFPNPPPNLQQNILNELRRLRRNGMPMNLNMNNIPEPSSSAAFKIMLGIHGAGILASFVTMPLAIASRAASEWINSFFSTKAVVDKLKAATKFELKKIAAEKASELAKIAANQQGRQALLRKGVLGGIGLLGSGGLAVAGTYGVKSLTESRTAWAKAEAEVWAEAQKIEELLRGAIEKILPDKVANVRFKDVVGQGKAKDKFEGILERLRNPERYQAHLAPDEDLVVPVIMDGPPGVGKTQMVRAMVGELNEQGVDADLIQLHCDKLSFKNTGARAIGSLKKMIEESKKKTIVIFMDEIDSLGSRLGGKAKPDTINSMLTLMSGLSKVKDKNVVWLGATNYYHNLDDAILSRFTQRITFNLPTDKELAQMYTQYFNAKKLYAPEKLNMAAIVKASRNFSGRDVQGAVALLKERLMSQLKGGQHTLSFTEEQLLEAVSDMARKKPPVDAHIAKVNPGNPFGLPPASEFPTAAPAA